MCCSCWTFRPRSCDAWSPPSTTSPRYKGQIDAREVLVAPELPQMILTRTVSHAAGFPLRVVQNKSTSKAYNMHIYLHTYTIHNQSLTFWIETSHNINIFACLDVKLAAVRCASFRREVKLETIVENRGSEKMQGKYLSKVKWITFLVKLWKQSQCHHMLYLNDGS